MEALSEFTGKLPTEPDELLQCVQKCQDTVTKLEGEMQTLDVSDEMYRKSHQLLHCAKTEEEFMEQIHQLCDVLEEDEDDDEVLDLRGLEAIKQALHTWFPEPDTLAGYNGNAKRNLYRYNYSQCMRLVEDYIAVAKGEKQRSPKEKRRHKKTMDTFVADVVFNKDEKAKEFPKLNRKRAVTVSGYEKEE